MAANAELGVELCSQDLEKDLAGLARERGKDPGLKHLTIRRARAEGMIWIVRLREAPGKPKGLGELDLAGLGLT